MTAQVAFLCHCYGQGNASVQAAIYLCQQLDPKVRQLLCLERLNIKSIPRICFIEHINIFKFEFQNASITDNETRNILKEDIPNLISYLLVVPGNYFKFDDILFLLHFK